MNQIKEARLRLERSLEEMDRVGREWDELVKIQERCSEKRLKWWREKINR